MHINNNSYHIASHAINHGLYNLSQAAHAIAQNGTTNEADNQQLVKDVIAVKQSSQYIQANMQVIKTIQETEEYLIDIMA